MNDPINDFVTCPVCSGSKYAGGDPVSECCGSPMRGDININPLCRKCEEHTEPQYCDFCDGTGEIKDYELTDYIEEQKADIEADRIMESNK